MRAVISLVAAVIVGLGIGAAAAQVAPADSAIKGALYDIERAEGQLGTLTPARKANITRLQRGMAMAERRLESSSNKGHPSWAEAASRLNAVKAALAALDAGRMPGAAPAQTGSPPPADPARAQTPAAPVQPGRAETAPAPAEADPAIGRAMREMNLLERRIAGQRSVTGRGAKRYLSELYRIGQGLAAVEDRAQPGWEDAAAHYGALKNRIVGLNLQILDKRFQAIEARIEKLTPVQYMLAQEVDPLRKGLRAAYADTNGLAAPKHPGVQGLIARIANAGNAFEGRVRAAIAERGKYGDVPAKLAEIKKRVHAIKVPDLNRWPVDETVLHAYIQGLDAARKHIETDGAYLAGIDGKVPLTVEQRNVFNFAKSSVTSAKPAQIKRSAEIATTSVDLGVKNEARFLEFIEETDPEDQSHRANRLLAKGRYEETLARLAKTRESIRLALVFDEAMGRSGGPDRAAQIERTDAAIEAYKSKFTRALSDNRMPEARSTSAKLRGVVAEVLAQPEYGYKYERFVINADIRTLEKETGSLSRGTVTSTVTVYKYKWDEFQATTAEKEGEAYYMYANTFKYFRSGDSTTPLNRWILSKRFRSSRILAENIKK